MTDPYEVVDHGLVPFLIDWGAAPHPGETAPEGLSLLDLKAWHPAPDEVNAKLSRMNLGLHAEYADEPRLLAVLESPAGRVALT